MEPLAHTLVGATLAETRLGRWTPLAAPALILGANLPDIDVATYLWGSDFALGHRRGWTHGVLAMVLLPPMLAALVLLWDRWVRRRFRPTAEPVRAGRLLALATLAVVTHPFLDWLNNYGIRLLSPFDDRWFYGDALFIVDPWLWLLLGGAVFLLRSRSRRSLVSWGLAAAATSAFVLAGAPGPAKGVWLAGLALLAALRLRGRLPRPGSAAGHRLAVAGLAAAGIYIALMVVSVPLARVAVRARMAHDPRTRSTPVLRLMVGPVPADPFHRQVVAALPGEYRTGRFRFLGEPRLELDAAPLPTPAPSPTVEKALDDPRVQGFLSWARFPFWVEERTPSETTVFLLDARYAQGPTRGFGGTAVELPAPTAPGDR